MKRRHKSHKTLLKKTRGKKKGWFARYRIHILSLLGLFALFFGVLSYYQQSNSVLGLAIDKSGGGNSSSGGHGSPNCGYTWTCSGTTQIFNFNTCTQIHGTHTITSNPFERKVKNSQQCGYKPPTNATKRAAPPPKPAITITANNIMCTRNDDLEMDLYIKTSYNSSGDSFMCRNCFIQSGEERMKAHEEYLESQHQLFNWGYNWTDDLSVAQTRANIVASVDPHGYNGFQDLLNDVNTDGKDLSINSFIAGAPNDYFPYTTGRLQNTGKNSYLATHLTYVNNWDGNHNTDHDTLGAYFLSLISQNGQDSGIANATPHDSDFDKLRVHAITIVDATKHNLASSPINLPQKCINGHMQ